MNSTEDLAAIRAAAIEHARKPLRERALERLYRVASAPAAARAAAALGLLSAAWLLIAPPAWAIDIPDAPAIGFMDLEGFIEWLGWFFTYGVLGSMAAGLLEFTFELIAQGVDAFGLTASFGAILGSGSSIETAVTDVANIVVKPCALTILAMAVLVQMVSIARRMDQQGGTLPAVREVFALFVFFVIFLALVNGADVLMRGVYELCRAIIESSADYLVGSSSVGYTDWTLPEGMDVGHMFLFLLGALLSFGVACGVSVIAFVVGAIRAIEIYLLTMFSPIPFAFMGFEGTRQWGVGYIKEFIAVCLGGAVLVGIQFFIPITLETIVGDLPDMATAFGTDVGGAILGLLSWELKLVGILLAAALTMFKSGAIARNILGG